jgi:hypothetical protein
LFLNRLQQKVQTKPILRLLPKFSRCAFARLCLLKIPFSDRKPKPQTKQNLCNTTTYKTLRRCPSRAGVAV